MRPKRAAKTSQKKGKARTAGRSSFNRILPLDKRNTGAEKAAGRKIGEAAERVAEGACLPPRTLPPTDKQRPPRAPVSVGTGNGV